MTFFYPGSSIGNFTRDEAFAFLRRIHARASGGGLLPENRGPPPPWDW